LQGIQVMQGPAAPLELNRSLRNSAFLYLLSLPALTLEWFKPAGSAFRSAIAAGPMVVLPLCGIL
jgi:hypothetical protein